MKQINTNEFTNDNFSNNVLLFNPIRNAHLGGIFEKSVRFVNAYQIKDIALWKRFVKQFLSPTDVSNRGWRCEYWGKMMRGAASVCAYSHDRELYEILRESVENMLLAQDGEGRISTYSPEKEFHGWDIWGRKYILLGMQYFSEICEDRGLHDRIRNAMCAHLDYMIERLGSKEGQTPITASSEMWLGANSCSILEPTVRMYQQTGEQRYLDFAKYIIDAASGREGELRIFAEAEENTKIPSDYCENKAYETMSCFEGLAEYYRVTGEEKYRTMVLNFGRRVLENEISIIGSGGCTHELFDNTRLHQVDPAFDGIMQETCVSVTWMKFCGQLLRLTGDPTYADCIETTFFNAFYGSYNTHRIETTNTKDERIYRETLPFDSYSALRPGTRGRQTGGMQRMADGTLYSCCACISPMGIGVLPPMCAMLAKDGIAVNFYFDGDVTAPMPSGEVVRFVTHTGYPYQNIVCMTVEPAEEEEFTLSLRIPAWSQNTIVTVNGETVTARNGYTAIRRLWKKGDQIQLTFDLRITRIDPPSDSEYAHDYVGLRRGCIILATDARLGYDPRQNVDIAFDREGHVAETILPHQNIPDCELCLSVPQKDGSSLKLIDYASAGKTWDETSLYAAWLPCGKTQMV